MSFNIVVTKRVNNQLVNAVDWYVENAPGHEKKTIERF